MKTTLWGQAALLALFVAAVSARGASAQTFEQVTPDIPAAEDSAPLPLPDLPGGADDEAVLVDALKGLVFLTKPAAIQAGGLRTRGIDTGGLDLLAEPDMRSALESFLGRPVSLALLDEVVTRVIGTYRDAGRPFVDVVVPEQDITSGTIQVLVLEFVAGEVRVSGETRLPSEDLRGQMRVRRGAPLDARTLEDDLDWLNRPMFRRVEVTLEPGADFGETDIVLDVEESRPWRIYAGMDNTGSRATGHERYFFGGNVAHVLADDALLSYQYLSSRELVNDGRLPFGLTDEKPAYLAHSVDYRVPFADRSELSVFGFYAESRPNLSGPFRSTGESFQASLRYHFPRRCWGQVKHQWSVGADFKRTNNDLGFGGTTVSSAKTDVLQAVLGWNAAMRDDQGTTSLGATLSLSPGGVTAFNDDRDYRPSATAVGRSNADARYAALRVDLARQHDLTDDVYLSGRVSAQTATTNLLPSEQIYAGGVRSVRGFEDNEAAGDHGVVANLELRGPTLSVLDGLTGVPDAFQAYLFVDRGDVWLDDPAPGETLRRSLMSAGAGFSYRFGPYVSADVAHGTQITGRDNNRAESSRTHVRVSVSF